MEALMAKTQNEKVVERVRKRALAETKAHWKNALRSSPERLRALANATLARSHHATTLPTCRITAAAAAKIDAKIGAPVQLDMFGGCND
jgi:hypothetical protein